ncbi:hypothetical protein KNLIENLN_00018 [Sinorhizobium phage NV1.1.1]|nr:hypothetical protein KNLIENLN_00018 [Sinorhizobium phage NV1.1.1]
MFKAGDKVRCIDAEGTTVVSFGKEYEVAEVDGEYLQVLVDGSERGMYAYRFELVEQPWQPKVGDRVRRVKGSSMSTEHGSHEAGFVGIIADIDDDYGKVFVFENGHRGYANQYEPLPVAAEAQPALRIEAGKFYRTRDGRKVGPMRVYGGGGLDRSFVFGQVAAFTAPDLEDERVGGSYTSNGTWLTSSGHSPYDLIAEWVDEPAVVPAVAVAATACNDNAPVASDAKFKVGDEVRHKSLGYEGTIKEILDGEIARTYWPKKGWGASDPFEDLELISASAPEPTAIVALIEDGQPLPATRPHVHADVTAAIKEAERLAGLRRGQRFGVYVLHDTRETDQPDYGHEWKNLAARGQKIAAIKELRSLTGLNLVAAKTAVEKWAEYELAA